jgi:CBS domain-containing protein
MNTPVSVLLARKGHSVQTIEASATVAEAVRLMNEKRIGSIVVTEQGRLAGIFTERDVLTRIVGAGRDPGRTLVAEVMSARPHTISPMTTTAEAMEIFTHERCRHLPVVNEGRLEGLISIGDVSRWLTDSHKNEAEQLRQYISGGYPTN